ncbi:MAG TPA: hypothetical protein VL053_07245 [Arachidicoccus sp.]|nr:hypothetical protein [Arachidicoccus sp.]
MNRSLPELEDHDRPKIDLYSIIENWISENEQDFLYLSVLSKSVEDFGEQKFKK